MRAGAGADVPVRKTGHCQLKLIVDGGRDCGVHRRTYNTTGQARVDVPVT
jgi:hypothetical protein